MITHFKTPLNIVKLTEVSLKIYISLASYLLMEYTSEDFTNALKDHGIKISMDGKGHWMANVFIERLWRSLKHEEIYLKAYDSVAQAKQGIGDWLVFYYQDRRHASLNRMTPDQIYFDLPSGLPISSMEQTLGFHLLMLFHCVTDGLHRSGPQN